jgi:formylmethanofuran dehydrogenase subunit E
MSYVKIGKELRKIKPNKKSRIYRHGTCEFCGEKFISARKTAHYCSNACKQAAYRIRLTEYLE